MSLAAANEISVDVAVAAVSSEVGIKMAPKAFQHFVFTLCWREFSERLRCIPFFWSKAGDVQVKMDLRSVFSQHATC